MPSAAEYIDDLRRRGLYTFTTDQAVVALGVSVVAARAALRRLAEKGKVAHPYRGFYTILPPPYRQSGCLPADYFVPDLMAYIGQPYYVGLLSAAAYHGAAHQAPMEFQVVTPTARRPVECGSTRVVFVARRDMEETSVVERNTPAGTIRVASPEATAFELVGYPVHAGYLDNITTVLTDLAPYFDRSALVVEGRRAPLTWVQRLGYLLVQIGHDEIARSLDPLLMERRLFPTPLAPWRDSTGALRDPRWNLVVNVEIEPDA